LCKKPSVEDCKRDPKYPGCPTYCKDNENYKYCIKPTDDECENDKEKEGCPMFC